MPPSCQSGSLSTGSLPCGSFQDGNGCAAQPQRVYQDRARRERITGGFRCADRARDAGAQQGGAISGEASGGKAGRALASVIPAVAGPARLVPLSALATPDLMAPAPVRGGRAREASSGPQRQRPVAQLPGLGGGIQADSLPQGSGLKAGDRIAAMAKRPPAQVRRSPRARRSPNLRCGTRPSACLAGRQLRSGGACDRVDISWRRRPVADCGAWR